MPTTNARTTKRTASKMPNHNHDSPSTGDSSSDPLTLFGCTLGTSVPVGGGELVGEAGCGVGLDVVGLGVGEGIGV